MEPKVIDSGRRLRQLERRLEILDKICRHDLPNQLVVIRGLVNFLQEERLDVEGQEYVRRLSGAAERALDMMQALKTLLAVDALADKPEDIDLYDLAQEASREIKKLFPERHIEYHFSITVPKAKGPHRAVRKAVEELLRCVLSSQAGAVVEIGSRAAPHGVELTLAVAQERILPLDLAFGAPGNDAAALEKHLELLVVRELVEAWGGALRSVDIPGKMVLYVLLLPDVH